MLGHIPLSSMRFVQAVVWEWMIGVGYLPHGFDIISYTGAYFLLFFKYSWDWGNCQLDFRLSTSLGLPMIYDIRTFLHGFVEIEMDHIRFHLRSIDGFFSRMFMRQIVFVISTLQIRLSRWAVFCALWDLFLDELWCTHFEIHFLKFSDITSFETHKEFFWFKIFIDFCYGALNFDSLILENGWFIGCFRSMSTLDTGAYFPS